MGYVQITLNDWLEMKQKLERDLLGVSRGFVRIGFTLRQIDDQKLYEKDGYKSVAEFAKAEHGLEQSTISKFMSINREYSVDGYSEILRPEFEGFNRSQLEEMLKLPVNDREMIQRETQRDDIRQLKKFNKSEPEAGIADDIRQLVEKFYEDNPDILNNVFSVPEFDEQTIEQFVEIVNPGGNRSYKKGMFFMMMYENRVAVKKFGSSPQDMTWWEFYLATRDIFGNMAAGNKTWEKYFGKEENAPAHKSDEVPGREALKEAGSGEDGADTEAENMPEKECVAKKEGIAAGETGEQDGGVEGSEADSGGMQEKGIAEEGTDSQKPADGTTAPDSGENQTKENAPAHKSAEILNIGADETGNYEDNQQADTKAVPEAESNDASEAAGIEDEIPGQMELTKDFPEYCPEETGNAEPEAVKEAYTCRLLYMASKGCGEASAYMAEAMEKKIRGMNNVSFSVLTKAGFWEEFFNAEVDKEGREIECV